MDKWKVDLKNPISLRSANDGIVWSFDPNGPKGKLEFPNLSCLSHTMRKAIVLDICRKFGLVQRASDSNKFCIVPNYNEGDCIVKVFIVQPETGLILVELTKEVREAHMHAPENL